MRPLKLHLSPHCFCDKTGHRNRFPGILESQQVSHMQWWPAICSGETEQTLPETRQERTHTCGCFLTITPHLHTHTNYTLILVHAHIIHTHADIYMHKSYMQHITYICIIYITHIYIYAHMHTSYTYTKTYIHTGCGIIFCML